MFSRSRALIQYGFRYKIGHLSYTTSLVKINEDRTLENSTRYNEIARYYMLYRIPQQPRFGDKLL